MEEERQGLKKLNIMRPIEKIVGLDEEEQVLLDHNFNVAERMFFLADTNAFIDPCCVIPDVGGPRNRYYLMESRENWPDIFMTWLHTPVDDDMVIEGDLTEEEETDDDEEGGGSDEDDNNSTLHDQNPQEMEENLKSGGESSSEES